MCDLFCNFIVLTELQTVTRYIAPAAAASPAAAAHLSGSKYNAQLKHILLVVWL
jgi:hypothetical protein